VLEVRLALARSLGKEEQGKEGRPAIYPDELYIALPITCSYFNWTYRETEAFFRGLFPEKPFPSFQALHWYMKRKFGEKKLFKLLELMKECLCTFLGSDEILILDSTGIPHNGAERWRGICS